MKNLLKFLSGFLIISSFAACEKKQDWTCQCIDIVALTITDTPILNTREEEARKSCDKGDFGFLVTTTECELVE